MPKGLKAPQRSGGRSSGARSCRAGRRPGRGARRGGAGASRCAARRRRGVTVDRPRAPRPPSRATTGSRRRHAHPHLPPAPAEDREPHGATEPALGERQRPRAGRARRAAHSSTVPAPGAGVDRARPLERLHDLGRRGEAVGRRPRRARGRRSSCSVQRSGCSATGLNGSHASSRRRWSFQYGWSWMPRSTVSVTSAPAAFSAAAKSSLWKRRSVSPIEPGGDRLADCSAPAPRGRGRRRR